MRRQVSQKAEASSDNITMVYRALRVEESPTNLRKVLPDTKDYSIWSLHMFPCAFLFGFFLFFGVKPVHCIQHCVGLIWSFHRIDGAF